jgi:hypothetical protein
VEKFQPRITRIFADGEEASTLQIGEGRRAAEPQPKGKIRNPKKFKLGGKGNEVNGERGFIREFREFPRILGRGILTADDADVRGWGKQRKDRIITRQDHGAIPFNR